MVWLICCGGCNVDLELIIVSFEFELEVYPPIHWQPDPIFCFPIVKGVLFMLYHVWNFLAILVLKLYTNNSGNVFVDVMLFVLVTIPLLRDYCFQHENNTWALFCFQDALVQNNEIIKSIINLLLEEGSMPKWLSNGHLLVSKIISLDYGCSKNNVKEGWW